MIFDWRHPSILFATRQRRFYDFNVWSEKKLREKLNYMHRNPVDRRLVEHPRDWPWSSWSFYGKGEEGVIHIDVPRPTAQAQRQTRE